jgi:hypothetical protein
MSRRCPRLAVAGAILITGIGFAAPASAAVRYDPEAKTGFVDTADVRRAFGWTTATLVLRAGGVAFDQEFWTDDTYSVACAGRVHPVVHHRVYGRFELIDAVVRRDGPRSSTGYGDGITGFRLTGASSGISGTSVPPALGRPCPAGPGSAPGSKIDELHLVFSVTGWSLVVRSVEDRRVLRRATVQRTFRISRCAGAGTPECTGPTRLP